LENVQIVDDPEESDVTLIAHDGDPIKTAAEVESHVTLGRRVAVLDVRYADQGMGDPALIPALLNTAVYVSNLAAYDTDLERALAVVMTPMRDGTAHRRCLAENLLYWWAWRGIVRGELIHSFGDQPIPENRRARAEMQARSRMGAELVRLRGRGMRFFISRVGFRDDLVDGFWFEIQPEGT
jgi:hypothetical protein